MTTLVNPFKLSLACCALLFLSACNGGGGGSSTKQTDNAAATVDSRPIAHAGLDQIVTGGQLVTLNGSASYDPEGSNLLFQWRQISGTAITLSSEADDTPSFIAPTLGQTLSFQLVTDDGKNLSIGDTVTITIISANSSTEDNNSENNDSENNNSGNGNSNEGSDNNNSSDNDNSSENDNQSEDTNSSDDTDNNNSSGESESETENTETDPVIENTAPIAHPGQNRSVDGFSLVILDGSLSSDPENDSLNYHWQQISGTTVNLNSSTIVSPNFDAPNINDTLIFSLSVSDAEFTSEAKEVSITIQSVNSAPIADAGTDKIVLGLSDVYLDGSLSRDPENETLTYTWNQSSGTIVTLQNADTISPNFFAPNINDTLVFSLTVNDGELSSVMDTVFITTKPINTPPIAHAGVDRYVGSLSVVALNGTLSEDADNNPITFTWSQTSGPSVILSDVHAAKPIFTANTDGQLIFSLIVNDGQDNSEADTVTVAVGPIPATNIKVNGTGITWGGNYPTGNNSSCTGEAIEQQDCSLGRELTHNDDADGRVGFSFTKFNNNGVDVGNNASDWQCVQDNVTGLMWEIKSGGNGVIGDEGINDADDRFSWHNSDPSSNGGGSGFMNNQGEVCSDYDSENPQTHCNTQAFVERMNKNAWCGFADWRLPTRKELLSIVDYGNALPMMDNDYFPEIGQFVWTSTPLALGSVSAWGVNFQYGNSFSIDKRNARQVRLVRGGYEQTNN